MVDPIAESIDTTLRAIGADESMTIDRVLDHLEHSAQFQKLITAHVSRFYDSDNPVPDRIRLAVIHTFWLGFEAGRAVEQVSKLEAMIA